MGLIEMNVSIIALDYILYHFKAGFWVSTDDDGVETYSIPIEEIKRKFCEKYNVKSIYDLTQKQVDEDFEKRKHIGGKYIYFKEDYLLNDWGKDVAV